MRCFSSPGKDTRHNCLSALQQCQSWPRSCLLFCNSSSEQLWGYSGAVHPVFGLVGISQYFPCRKNLTIFVLDQKVARQDIEWQLLSPTETVNPTSGIFVIWNIRKDDWNPISCCRAFLLNIHRFLQRQQVLTFYTNWLRIFWRNQQFKGDVRRVRGGTGWQDALQQSHAHECGCCWSRQTAGLHFLSSYLVSIFQCSGLSVLHFPWCWLTTGGRQKPLHLPNSTETYVQQKKLCNKKLDFSHLSGCFK